MALSRLIIQGLIGGAAGAGCMTAVRMMARRLGWIDFTPPQEMRSWMGKRLGGQPDGAGTRQLFDALVHLGVAVGGGTAYGMLMPRMPQAILISGPLFGMAVWALAFGVLAPQLGITRSPRRGTWPETGVNLTAHLVYGAVTALVASELRRQVDGGEASLRAVRARVG